MARADVDRNACNTRDDVLRTQLSKVTLRRGGCFVDSGTLKDPYTGRVVAFRRGPKTSGQVEVDHIVSEAATEAGS